MSDYETYTSSSPVSSSPPILPPIPRVASRHESHAPESEGLDTVSRAAASTISKEDGQILTQTLPLLTDSLPPNMTGNEERQRLGYSTGPRWPSATQESDIGERRKGDHTSHTSIGNELRSHSETQLAQSPSPRPGTSDTFYGESSQYTPQPRPSQLPTSNSNHTRSSKTKLNMLNPMSLLARRRTSQIQPQSPSETHVSNRNSPVPGMRLPDDYDPRIRGKMVHDFSAPRPKHNAHHSDGTSPSPNAQRPQATLQQDSSNDTATSSRTDRKGNSGQSGSLSADEGGPISMEREHTPIFKEHFGDDVEPWRSDQGLMIKQPATIYMSQISVPDRGHDPSSMPAFARNLPLDISNTLRLAPTRAPPPPPTTPPIQSLPAVEEISILTPFFNHSSTLPSPPISPPKNRSRATSNTDPNFQSAGLPSHLPSNASRFSFDLAGVGSATQEKHLEEKHRQLAAQDARKKITSSPPEEDEDDGGESDFDYMDDDGLEERIPGVNTDADDENIGRTAMPLEKLHVASRTLNNQTSPESTFPTSSTMPWNVAGHSTVFAPSKESLVLSQQRHSDVSQNSLDGQRDQYYTSHHELAVSATGTPEDHSLSAPHIYNSRDRGRSSPPGAVEEDDDDMYFDDGIIDNLDEDDGEAFDESVFDDETSRIYSIPIRDLKYMPAELATGPPERFRQPFDRSRLSALNTSIDTSSLGLKGFTDHIAQPTSNTDHQHPRPASYDHKAGLTQDNLAAYHDALAFAANQAALDGKFIRKPSIDDSAEYPPNHNNSLETTTNNNGFNQNTLHSPSSSSFDFDDTLEDDAIIAAANAEALENDDEGFYGREFNFFARASSSSTEAEYANGGYFGARHSAHPDSIGRSHSGRVNGQEPSLTPITERSEWSNRTSLAMGTCGGVGHAPPPPQLSTPGLAQLADMLRDEDREGDMSLSALLRLRRGAWGGSNASLKSSAASQQSGGSPLTHFPPGALASGLGLVASGSCYSLRSGPSPSEGGSPPASPTLTSVVAVGAAGSASGHAHVAEVGFAAASGGVSMQGGGDGFGGGGRSKGVARAAHSRNSSVASESVSYVQDVDEFGVDRWWLETRRVGEGAEGGVVVGRRVVEGGRI